MKCVHLCGIAPKNLPKKLMQTANGSRFAIEIGLSVFWIGLKFIPFNGLQGILREAAANETVGLLDRSLSRTT